MSLCFPLQGFKEFIVGDKIIYIYMCLVRVILSFPTRRHKTYLNVTQTAQDVWSRPNKILMIKYRMNNIKHLVVIKSIDTYTCINFLRNRICLGTDLNLHCRVFQQKDAMSCCRTSLKMVSQHLFTKERQTIINLCFLAKENNIAVKKMSIYKISTNGIQILHNK